MLRDFPVGRWGNFESSLALPRNYQQESPLSVDQTNESFVLERDVIVKWQLILGHSSALGKERFLFEAGFAHVPRNYGHLTWRDEEENEFLVCSAQQFLPGSRDGWSWCVEGARKGLPLDWVPMIADIVAEMHECFGNSGFAHGDLHVGQFLSTGSAFHVIDFDGNPLGKKKESWLGDLVSMLCSFIHVAAVAEVKYATEYDMNQWVDDVSELFLSRYQSRRPHAALPHYPSLLELMAENEKVELEYASRFLPEWLYAAEYGRAFVENKQRARS